MSVRFTITQPTEAQNPEILFSYLTSLKEPKEYTNLLKAITESISACPSEFYEQFIEQIRKINTNTTSTDTHLYESILRSFRKSHGLPSKAFDQNLIITGKDGSEHVFSKELLTLSSVYFKKIFSSEYTKSIPKNGFYRIQIALSNSAIESLLAYFTSRCIPTEDIHVLHELLAYALQIEKKSFGGAICEKIITTLIKDENRDQFYPDAICGLEGVFIEQYLSVHNIPLETTNLRFSLTLTDLLERFNIDDALSRFLLTHSNTVRFNSADYPTSHSLQEHCRKFIYNLVLTDAQGDLEKLFTHIHSLFPNLEHIQIEHESIVEAYVATHLDIPFTKASLAAHYLSKNRESSEPIALLKELLEINPEHFFALTTLGNHFREQGNPDAAIPLLEKALQIHPQYSFALAILGDCLQQKNQLGAAIPILQQALEINPHSVLSLITLGNCLNQKGEPDEAIPLLRKALKIDPKNPFALATLGDCFYQEDDAHGREFSEAQPFFDRAIIVLEETLKMDPNNIFILVALASCLQKVHIPRINYGEFNKIDPLKRAITLLEKALSINPCTISALTSLSSCLQKKDKHNEAMTLSKRALEINPRDTFALTAHGSCLQKEDRLNEAICTLEQALEINPNFVPALKILSFCFKQRGEYDKAIPFLEKFLQINPDSTTMRFSLIECLKKNGEVDKAKRLLLTHTIIQPTRRANREIWLKTSTFPRVHI